ncbi:MAG: TonB-dependent receptor [Flavobacteriales bacterium]
MKKNMLRGLLSAFYLCFVVSASAQYEVRVQVLDSASIITVPGASVIAVGTNLGASTDGDGLATLRGVPAGEYVLQVASIGYITSETRITVPLADQPLRVRLRAESTQLHEMVVNATRTSSRIEDAPQKIEVLGAEDLLEEGSLKPGNVASLLGDISSVQVQQTSAVSSASVIRMQGLEGRHTLLLRDGMPAYGGLSGGFDILRIPPLDLQRIEVIKGPSSTFNGGGAIAGAINFVTKEPGDTLSGLVLLNRSTLTETNANAYISGPLGPVGYTLFAGAIDQQAVDVNGDGYSDVPEIRGYQVHPQLFFDVGERTHVRAGVWWQTEDRTGGDMQAIGRPADTARYFGFQQGERLAADVLLERTLSERATITMKGSLNDYQQHNADNFTSTDRQQGNEFAEAFWSNTTERRSWVFGAGYTGSRLQGEGPAQVLTTVGSYGQLALHRARWPEIQLGMRVDHNTTYGTQVLPAIAAMFHATETITLRGSAGSGYQLPDRSKGYGPVSSDATATMIADGSVAERSYGATAEWTWRKQLGEETALFVDQTFFGTLIAHPLFTQATGTDVVLGNADATRITRGIDNYVRLSLGATEVYLGYTFTLPEDVVDQQATTIMYTPLHRMATTLSHEFGEHWRAGVEAAWSGQQERGDGTRTRDQWFVAGMVGYFAGPWAFVLNGENITDTRQSNWEQVVFPPVSRPRFATLWAPLEGRAINLSVLWKFG